MSFDGVEQGVVLECSVLSKLCFCNGASEGTAEAAEFLTFHFR